mgnify:CR=1 FL=1
MIRDSLGLLELDSIGYGDICYTRGYSHFYFIYNETKYYFKRTFSLDTIYNELIAEEIAKEFGILCVHYDLASFRGNVGVICEDFVKDGKYQRLSDILYNDSYNNLEQIEQTLKEKYYSDYVVESLMQELINIYMFDIVIGNSDRHVDNLGILENKLGIHFGPVFDNDLMLFDNAVYGNYYSIGVGRNDKNYDGHIVNKFIETYGEEYRDILLSKMEIVSPDNMQRIIKRVEKRIGTELNDYIKEKILKEMAFYYEKMKGVLSRDKSYKRV